MENPNPDNADLEDTNSDDAEQAVIDSTHSYGPWPWVFLGCFFITIVGVVAYLVGTADVRFKESTARLAEEKKEAAAKLERTATAALIQFAAGEASSMNASERGPVQLMCGEWAKAKFYVETPEWELKRSESGGYPFDGTVKIQYTRYATIYRKSKDLVEKDEDFYPTVDENFYDSEGTYSSKYSVPNLRSKKTLTIQLVYDPDSG